MAGCGRHCQFLQKQLNRWFNYHCICAHIIDSNNFTQSPAIAFCCRGGVGCSSLTRGRLRRLVRQHFCSNYEGHFIVVCFRTFLDSWIVSRAGSHFFQEFIPRFCRRCCTCIIFETGLQLIIVSKRQAVNSQEKEYQAHHEVIDLHAILRICLFIQFRHFLFILKIEILNKIEKVFIFS